MKTFAFSAFSAAVLFALTSSGYRSSARADDEPPAEDNLNFDLAEGRLVLTAPEGWLRKEPANRIIEHEFQVPASEGDERPGRMTVTSAGGTINANIDRWIGQFSQPDGSSTKDKIKQEKLTVAGQEITLIDVSGTYDDSPPFAGGGEKRENYRLLGAIVATKEGKKKTGNYYVKFVGPNQTVEDHAEGFRKMLDGLKAAK
ncbi:MAG TPA: gluconolactonase [Pirellulales bacterium]|nr:gluconolactonase [Pirellulales bacterium]